MAIKTSNQITFTEQKKIVELREWYLATSLEDGVTRETEGWTTSPQSVNSNKKYLWNYEEVIYSIGEPEVSEPVLIGMYGTGADGNGITDILNFYGVTQEPELPEEIPDTFWKDNLSAIKELSSINKYLWNYEKILYTDGSSMVSEPMIIGVYGDSGESAIAFQIYSPTGFEFKDSVDESEQITSIELRVAAFEGSEPLTGATFTWSYWDGNLNDYQEIVTTTDTSFIVNNTDTYALSNLKCTMWHNDKPYEDYVTLSTKLDIYSASIKFFNGTNIFSQTEEYLVGYIDLYKNNKLEESADTYSCYTGDSRIDKNTGVITTDYTGESTLSYFVCYQTLYTPVEVNDKTVGEYWILENDEYVVKNLPDEYDSVATYYSFNKVYELALGKYDGEKWCVIDDSTKYIYQNDIDPTTTSNVFFISKRDVNKARDINIYVYTKYTDIIDENGVVTSTIDLSSMIATTHVTITDLNDVIVSSEEPFNIYEGQLWLDTTNNILKIYSNGEWVNTSKQKRGQDTYTIKPRSYDEGDLWIVSKEDEFDKFTEGSIWVAIQKSDETGFNTDHWSDAVPEITELRSNINYFFDMNPGTGLKISNNSDRFYVNITSSKMSFCENPDIVVSGEEIEEEYNPHEVVHIGNKSATIRNLVVEQNADINCAASIDNKVNVVNTYETKEESPGFTWQIEPDGGFSLVKMEVE